MATAAWPNNLPPLLTSFVGRTAERQQVVAALAGTRLLVLTGSGGSGKTRLAIEVAIASEASFPDGAVWVDLSPVGRDEHVGEALANVLDVRPLPGHTHTQAAVAHLGAGRTLVVLDNCEQVPEGAADLSEALLRGCPRVVVLATSRTPLRVPGETDWRVPSLSQPDAVALFFERAASVRPDFTPDDENAATVARICRDVDGIPLAIELAAARVRVLSADEIAEGLRDRFRLLTGGPRGVQERQRTLRASIDWSYELLSPEEQLLFRRLAVFIGGWSLDAVKAVCDDDGVLDLLTSLADKSLVVVDRVARHSRYRLLETVREYALELLVASDESIAMRERHLDFYSALAERVAQDLNTPRVLGCIDILDPEAANIDAAIEHAIEHHPEAALRLGVTLTAWWKLRGLYEVGKRALTRCLDAADASPSPLRARGLWSCAFMARFRGDADTARAYGQMALGMADTDDWTMSMVLQTVGALQMFSDPAASRPVLERAIALCRKHGDPWPRMLVATVLARSYVFTDEVAEAERVLSDERDVLERVGPEAVYQFHSTLANCALARGDLQRAVALSNEAVSAARDLGDALAESLAHGTCARVELAQGRAAEALGRMQAIESRLIAKGAFIGMAGARIELARALTALGRLDEARELLEIVVAGGADGGWHSCRALLALSEVLRVLGETDASHARATEALDVSARVGTRSHGAAARELLAQLRIAAGEWGEAETLVHQALAGCIDIGMPLPMPQLFDALAQIASGLDSHVEAARLVGAADRARADLGSVRWPLHVPAMAALERDVRVRLGGETFDTAYAEGSAMPVDETIAWVRRARGTRKRPTAGWESLTPTELQVVDLVVEGLTNPKIAERMFISRATVKVHLGHVFGKLQVRTRSELAALAARRSG